MQNLVVPDEEESIRMPMDTTAATFCGISSFFTRTMHTTK
jgi:hypothetical protein